MTKLSEVEGKVSEILDEVKKGTAEVIAKIAALEQALTDPEVPGSVDTALADLKAAADALDAIVPDEPPPPPVE